MDKLSKLTSKINIQKQPPQQKTFSETLPQTLENKSAIVLKNFPDQMSFTIAMNHSACMERYKSKNTVLDCLKFDTIKISDLRSLYSENTPKYFLRSWLLQLNLFVNVSDENKLSEAQMIELAFLMYKEIYMLNLAELTLLFERIKSGFYFPFYNRIDATQILIACRSYRKERSVHLIEIEQRKIIENDLKRVEMEARSETRRIKFSILSKRKNRIINRNNNKTE